MTSTSQRIARLAVTTLIYYFALFTAACWICDFFFQGAFDCQFWYRLFARPGEVVLPVVFVSLFFVQRWNRWLARIGLLSCVLWTVWALLPRL